MILLSRPYKGYAPGTVVSLATQEETSLISQGFGANSVGPVTPGNVATTASMGRLGVAAAVAAVVLTNPSITPESRFTAYLSNAAADGTATSVTRIVAGVGIATFNLNAAATAAVAIDWALLPISGNLPPN